MFPQDVIVPSTSTDLGLAFHSARNARLIKIHGSLEAPSTWVLTRDEYDRAYAEGGRIRNFWRSIPTPLLFIGFSFRDLEVVNRLRGAYKETGKPIFAALHIEEISAKEPILKDSGVIPIGFYTHDQIAETIDDIFDCPKIDTYVTTSSRMTSIRVGGASTELMQPEISQSLTISKVVSNALDYRPNVSQISGNERRAENGAKGGYRSSVANLARLDQINVLAPVIRMLSQYPDVFLETLLPSLIRHRDIDLFKFFSTTEAELVRDQEIWIAVQKLLSASLSDFEIYWRSRRAICSFLGSRALHDAGELPPPTVELSGLSVCIYPLTRFQVGELFQDSALKSSQPMKPYTLGALEEADEILRLLGERTGRVWRLPTEDEWRTIAGVGQGSWPWGSELPVIERHAHISFPEQGGAIYRGPLEIGLFPVGKSKGGLQDLIGNVYELVGPPYVRGHRREEFGLAGGAWTSKADANPFRFISRLGGGHNNVGVRPVSSPTN